jgi:hypothetical protein
VDYVVYFTIFIEIKMVDDVPSVQHAHFTFQHELYNALSPGIQAEEIKAELPDWREPIVDYLWDSSYDLLSSLLWWMENCIVELQIICFYRVWIRIKLKWLQVKFIKELRRAGFYWTNMIANCFGYYKGCDECQRFGNIQLAPTVMMQQIIKPLSFR